MCADAAQTDPYFAKSLYGGGAGERAKIWACSAFLANLAVFGPLGQFWTNLAKLAIFDNFWDFPNLGQILRDFGQNLDFFRPFGPFLAIWQFWWILGKFGGFGKFRHFRHFWQFWQFQTNLEIFGNFGDFPNFG